MVMFASSGRKDSLTNIEQTGEFVCSLVRLDDSIQITLVDQELEAGLRSIAVPLRDSNGSVLAALNVGTQTDRVSKRRIMDEILPELRSTAQEINTVLSRR